MRPKNVKSAAQCSVCQTVLVRFFSHGNSVCVCVCVCVFVRRITTDICVSLSQTVNAKAVITKTVMNKTFLLY